MTCPTREAGGALRERPGIVYPLLPRAQRPDTSVAIEAALPEAAAIGRQALPPTVVDIGNTSQPQPAPWTRRLASRKPSRKRRRNRSMGGSGRPRARRPMDTGVINSTPVINKVSKVTWYKQSLESDLV